MSSYDIEVTVFCWSYLKKYIKIKIPSYCNKSGLRFYIFFCALNLAVVVNEDCTDFSTQQGEEPN